MNEAEQLFKDVGFWNMPCIRISEAQLLEKLIKKVNKNGR